MSFILDALRKSDNQRQQQAAPDLTTAQQQVSKPRPGVWVPLLVLVLALNVAVLGWIWLTDGGEGSPDVTPASNTTTDTERAADPRSLREEARREAEPPASTAASGDARPAATIGSATEAPPEPPLASGIASEPAGDAFVDSDDDTIQPAIPSFEQLAVAGIIATPQLHLDIHVFAGEPAKRFVFINMNRYREGDQLEEGPLVEEITETGVILNHQGSRFTLERN